MPEPGQDPTRKLRVFLCHASGDKPAVSRLYQRLVKDGMDPWLDKKVLLPGQDWPREIRKAVKSSDVVLVCLSRGSITKEGFVQKEIKFALDAADEKPPGTIFLIPVKLEECEVPERLGGIHWTDLFRRGGYNLLKDALRERAQQLQLPVPEGSKRRDPEPAPTPRVESGLQIRDGVEENQLYRFDEAGDVHLSIHMLVTNTATRSLTLIVPLVEFDNPSVEARNGYLRVETGSGKKSVAMSSGRTAVLSAHFTVTRKVAWRNGDQLSGVLRVRVAQPGFESTQYRFRVAFWPYGSRTQ